MTTQEINKIHSTKSAIKGKQYTNDKGDVYIGIENGRLKAVDMVLLNVLKEIFK